MDMRIASDEYGKQMDIALAAVRRMYADTSKMLHDCDSTIGRGKKPIHGNNIVCGQSFTLNKSDEWMPQFAYRYYEPVPTVESGVIEAVVVCFS